MAKVTKREQFEAIFGILADAGEANLADFVAGEITKLDKRKNADRALTKTQRENIALKNEIVATLTADGVTATNVAGVLDVNVQKATALLTQLRKEGRVVRVEDGKVTLFRLAE